MSLLAFLKSTTITLSDLECVFFALTNLSLSSKTFVHNAAPAVDTAPTITNVPIVLKIFLVSTSITSIKVTADLAKIKKKMTSGSAQRKPLPGGYHLLLSYYLAVRLRVSPQDFHPHLSIFFWQGCATFRCCKDFHLGSFPDKSILDFSHPLHNTICKICGRKRKGEPWGLGPHLNGHAAFQPDFTCTSSIQDSS